MSPGIENQWPEATRFSCNEMAFYHSYVMTRTASDKFHSSVHLEEEAGKDVVDEEPIALWPCIKLQT